MHWSSTSLRYAQTERAVLSRNVIHCTNLLHFDLAQAVKGQNEAEGCFQQALEIAQRQEAKSWELRGALSLGRLRQTQGKTQEARAIVEGIYSWFTEGFDTKDLQDAETLLQELGSTIERAMKPAGETFEALRPPAVFPVQEPLVLVTPEAEEETEPTCEVPGEASPDVAEQICRREGQYWTIVFQDSVCRPKDNRGMQYVAQLLFHPHEELHALALISQDAAPVTGGETPIDRTEELAVGQLTDAGEMLDPQARTAYRQRLEELQAELAEAQAYNDMGRVEQLQEELDFLARELSQAVGLGGRARRVSSPAERARVNVTRAIRATLKKIAENHPALGDHLDRTIKTGTYCSYTPDPRLPARWHD